MSDLDIDIMFLKLFRRKLMQFQRGRRILRKRSVAFKFIRNTHVSCFGSQHSNTRASKHNRALPLYAQLNI